MIATVSKLADVIGTLAFKIDAGQIIEHQRDAFGEALRVKLLFHPHPLSAQLIHRGIQVVLIEILARLVQAAGGGQESAAGVIDQSQFGAGEENAAKYHGFEQTHVADRADRAQDPVKLQCVPTLAQDGQATETPSVGQFQLGGGDKALAPQRLGNEFSGLFRQGGNVADGARAGALRSAKGFTDQVSEVRGGAAFASSGLDKHTCYLI